MSIGSAPTPDSITSSYPSPSAYSFREPSAPTTSYALTISLPVANLRSTGAADRLTCRESASRGAGDVAVLDLATSSVVSGYGWSRVGLAHRSESGSTVIRGSTRDPVWDDELARNFGAQRLGLTVRLGSRLARGRQILRWRIAGFERSMAQPYLPFFIEWAPGTPFPGRTRVDQPAPIQKVTRLALQGEIAQLEEWLGDERLPVTVAAGPPAVIGVGLATGSGEMFIGPP